MRARWLFPVVSALLLTTFGGVRGEKSELHTIDMTGGASELSKHFEFFVMSAKALGQHILVQQNLTVTFDVHPLTGKKRYFGLVWDRHCRRDRTGRYYSASNFVSTHQSSTGNLGNPSPSRVFLDALYGLPSHLPSTAKS